jgi:hypothetical protein
MAWSALRYGRYTPEEIAHGGHLIGGRVCRRVGFDVLANSLPFAVTQTQIIQYATAASRDKKKYV